MEKYKPIKELPEDIKQLPREETVCQFCGVSYLIHHEISKLEDRVRGLEEEIKRLKCIEDEKVSWEDERSRLVRERTLAVEDKGRLEEELRGVAKEARDFRSECEKLKEVERSQEAENKMLRTHQTRVLSRLRALQAEVSTLYQCRSEVKHLLTTTSDSLAQLRQQCSLKVSSYASNAGKVMKRLALENQNLHSKLERLKEEWTTTEVDLRQLLEAKQSVLEQEQLSTQQNQRKVQVLIEKAQELEQRLAAKDDKLVSLHKNQEENNINTRRLVAMATEECEKAKRRMRELEEEVTQARSDQTVAVTSLENARLELQRMEQAQIDAQLSLRHCEESLAVSETRAKALKSEHSQKIEVIKKEHKYHLESLCMRNKEDLERALQQANKAHLSSQREMQTQLAELKSTLTACELEKSRLVSSLQDQLQKEKDIADRDLTNHLNTVKALELALLQEKRSKKELEESVSKNSAETEHARMSAEKRKLDVEKKLSEAYQEISTLQRIVQRECEERERLTEELSLAKLRTSRNK